LIASISIPALPPATSPVFRLGTATGPGGRLEADAISLLRDGKRWLPTMGEFHYARYPLSEWREELLKLKAGGIGIIASYVFWIHHEEVEGVWNWTDQRDLRHFLTVCHEVGLPVVLRVGPWCHGEVRNGGLPDWVVAAGQTRSDNPAYLARVGRLFDQISAQASGMLWKDGGPVVAVQTDNEYSGPAEHLLTLKRMIVAAGLDVPLYTRTGWPNLSTPMPDGELLPLYGCYAEGFWDRSILPMPATYWTGFAFYLQRTDIAIGNDRLENSGDEEGAEKYPFLTCEIGGGMQVSYHRRIRFDPRDALGVVMTRLGAGSNLLGYYMAHGGTNPDGLTPLQEAQANQEWNDVPEKSYDFQTLLGEFGQTREQYHLLRPLHLFLNDFAEDIALTRPYLPVERPSGKEDSSTLRWSVRSDGERGFVFVNNYQRLLPMPAKEGVSFRVELPDSVVEFPVVTVPADSSFFWPFNLSVGGVCLRFATAQPVARVGNVVVFWATEGVEPVFAFPAGTRVDSHGAEVAEVDDLVVVWARSVGLDTAFSVGDSKVVVLSVEQTKQVYRASLGGRERLAFSSAEVVFDGDKLRLRSLESGEHRLWVYPPLEGLSHGGRSLEPASAGVFEEYVVEIPVVSAGSVRLEQIREAGPARPVQMGSEGVAEAPTEADFEHAAEWKISVEPKFGRLIRIRYVGDAARLYDGDRFLTDNFYNGTPFEFGTWRSSGELRLKVLPLRKDAPIMLLDLPDFGSTDSVVWVDGVEVVEELTVELVVK
jgi:beta-galactosidase